MEESLSLIFVMMVAMFPECLNPMTTWSGQVSKPFKFISILKINILYLGSLWGGGGIDMNWLDGMTGCGGECNIDGSTVTFSNFKLLDEGNLQH